jgi:pimeloyl-ACP methyl ester carboxylesterase
MREGTVQLKNGYQVGYAEYGAANGVPVFFFHGTPGSRKMRHPQESIPESMNVRLIAIDRPGYGLSDFQPNRTMLDWPENIAEISDQFGIAQFRIVGFSGGGPYALACAYKMPDRVVAVSLMNGVGPLDSCSPKVRSWPVQFAYRSATHANWLLKRVTQYAVEKAKQNFDRCFEWGVARLPECDREVIRRPEIRAIFRESLIEAFRQGSSGFTFDLNLLTRPWGFPLSEIKQPIAMWHGELDAFSNGRPLSQMIPNCKATFLPGEGHLVFFPHWKEILFELMGL